MKKRQVRGRALKLSMLQHTWCYSIMLINYHRWNNAIVVSTVCSMYAVWNVTVQVTWPHLTIMTTPPLASEHGTRDKLLKWQKKAYSIYTYKNRFSIIYSSTQQHSKETNTSVPWSEFSEANCILTAPSTWIFKVFLSSNIYTNKI